MDKCYYCEEPVNKIGYDGDGAICFYCHVTVCNDCIELEDDRGACCFSCVERDKNNDDDL